MEWAILESGGKSKQEQNQVAGLWQEGTPCVLHLHRDSVALDAEPQSAPILILENSQCA